MTKKSIHLLNSINKKILFIPTTTRSVEQYKRISIFNNNIPIKYAVVANGGIILRDEQIDLQWQKIISSKMKSIISPKELIKLCGFFLNSDYVKSYRCCDELFLYAVLKSDYLDFNHFESLNELCAKKGYSVIKNNKKVYIILNLLINGLL